MALTFMGGLFLDGKKNTADKKTEIFHDIDEYRIPLCQHAGDPCAPTVKIGDRVLLGQKIADDQGLNAANIHSPVSGTVTEVADGLYIVIKNDYLNESSPEIIPFGEKSGKTLDALTPDVLIAEVRAAGICGMSGAGVPTWKKLSLAADNVRRIIVNCIECEPYLTANHRLLLEDLKSVIGGLKILLYAYRIKNATVAVTDRDSKLVNKLKKELSGDEINLKVLENKYPQGDERQLIYALTGREVSAGKSGIEKGILVLNPQTLSEIYNAFVYGTPSIYRNLTVDGDLVKEPMNLRVKIGTPTKEILEFAGLKKDGGAITVIHGGPMMGNAIDSLDTPVIKTTTAVLVLDSKGEKSKKKSIFAKNTACIRCARCVDVCPMRLIPSDIARCFEKKKPQLAIKYGAQNCVLCGLCEYVCPANVPLLDYVRQAKNAENTKDSGGENG